MLKLTTHKGLAIFHLAKKAKKKIPLYEERKAYRVNVPFSDQILKKTRYCIFFRNSEGDWAYIGVEDNPVPTHL